MNARYGSLDLSDDMDGPPRFNFDPESLLPALAMTIGQPDVSGSSSKLNRRPASLQILSPRARAVNASQPSLQPPLPSLNNPSPRDKGKGRAVDIIELSDSDDDVKIVAPSNIKSTPGPSQPVPSTVATGTNQILPPASFEAITEPSTLPNLPQEEIAPRIASPPAQASIEGRVEALPREEPAVAGPSISNPLDRLIASVLEIIPDVDPAHLTVLFTTNNPGGDPQRAAQLLESILHSLLENGNYPKRQVEAKRKRQEERDIPTAGPSQPKRRKVETVVKMNVATTDRPRIPSMDYYKLSMVCHMYATREAAYLPLVLSWGEIPLCSGPLLEGDAHQTHEPLCSSICAPYEPPKR
jgi:TRIAD3 protein (E3 ubiquitin-protein ligase RNF216)